MPTVLPVATPPEVIETIPVELLLHTPPEVASVSVALPPTHMPTGFGVIPEGPDSTVNVSRTMHEPIL